MSRDIKNKNIVVTGAASGIGFEIADEFLNKGAKIVIVLDINEKLGVASEEKLKLKYGQDKVEFYKCDVTTDLEVVSKKLMDKFKTIDVLVNNAGISDEKKLKKVIDINVTASLAWALKFYEHMRKDKSGKGGTIMNMGSIYSYKIDAIIPIYKASKFAIRGFTRTLGHEYNYKRSGVRVISVCPSFTETNLGQNIELDEELKNYIGKYFSNVVYQKPRSVGRAAGEVFERAESGSLWEIEADGPIKEITENAENYLIY